MATHQFKINSATQKAAVKKMDAAAQIMKSVGISYASWCHILFETGCRFVENHIDQPWVQQGLLRNESLGFWDWWVVLWLEDDEILLSYRDMTNRGAYVYQKERLLALVQTGVKFDYFLKANKALQEVDQ